jgi:hypothetical protein
MHRPFVLRLGAGFEPSERKFSGWIEEVDTGIELHFHSTEELLAFLTRCIEREQGATENPRELLSVKRR